MGSSDFATAELLQNSSTILVQLLQHFHELLKREEEEREKADTRKYVWDAFISEIAKSGWLTRKLFTHASLRRIYLKIVENEDFTAATAAAAALNQTALKRRHGKQLSLTDLKL